MVLETVLKEKDRQMTISGQSFVFKYKQPHDIYIYFVPSIWIYMWYFKIRTSYVRNHKKSTKYLYDTSSYITLLDIGGFLLV